MFTRQAENILQDMLNLQTDTDTIKVIKSPNGDKLNNVDFQWFIVRTLPHQEQKLSAMLQQHQKDFKNILEVYCPVHTTVRVMHDGQHTPSPLFAGYVFVLSTQDTLYGFISRYYPEGTILYQRKTSANQKANFLTVPEEQMRAFMDFNENYADKVIVLERPYADYAFNPKTNEPNEIVRVIDGPLAGREGYLTRFRRDKRLVFNMRSFTSDRYYAVSVPEIWNFHVVRLHNAENDRLTVGTMKDRAVDLLVGLLQGYGYQENTPSMFHDIIQTLILKPSLAALCNTMSKQQHEKLGKRISQLTATDAELILNLVRYERDNPGYIKANWHTFTFRPFLTPTSGVELPEGTNETELPHPHFTEIIRQVPITEDVYYPSLEKDATVTTTYYAHIGHTTGKDGRSILFANWDRFLSEYFLTADKANKQLVRGTIRLVQDETDSDKKEKLIASFRNFSPTLYKVLTDEQSAVKVIRNLQVGNKSINALAILSPTDISQAKDELIQTGINICREINTTTHLAIWRRYLRSVWLHV